MRCWLALAACLLAVAGTTACADSDSGELNEAISDLESASGGSKHKDGPTTTSSERPSPQQLIRRYFELIDAGEFAAAWDYLDADVQEGFGGFESWRDGYATNSSTDVSKIDVTSTAGEETDLTVRIEAVDTCEGERYEQEFEGPFSVDVAAAKVTEAEFTLVSGNSPPEDCQ